MNILRTIFKDLSTFTRYAPGVETNMSLDDLQASGLTARKRVESIITAKVFSAILKEPDDAPLLDALCSGMANITRLRSLSSTASPGAKTMWMSTNTSWKR